MIKTAKALSIAGVALIAVAAMAATTMEPPSLRKHPHFSKTVTVKLGKTELKLSYRTTPANEERVKKVEQGTMVMGFAKIEIPEGYEIGGSEIDAGTYGIGAIKNGDEDWTLALYPGTVGRGEKPDQSKAIELESNLSTDMGNTGHVSFDLMPGRGDQEGKLTLIWHFGSLYLSGVFS